MRPGCVHPLFINWTVESCGVERPGACIDSVVHHVYYTNPYFPVSPWIDRPFRGRRAAVG